MKLLVKNWRGETPKRSPPKIVWMPFVPWIIISDDETNNSLIRRATGGSYRTFQREYSLKDLWNAYEFIMGSNHWGECCDKHGVPYRMKDGDEELVRRRVPSFEKSKALLIGSSNGRGVFFEPPAQDLGS